MLHDMKTACSSGHMSAGDAFSHYQGDASDEVRREMTCEASSKRNLRRYAAGVNPPKPKHLRDLVFDDMPAEFKTTTDGRRFLLHDNGPEAAERVVIFSTDEQLKLMAEADSIDMDGTFDTSPDLYIQLFTIRL